MVSFSQTIAFLLPILPLTLATPGNVYVCGANGWGLPCNVLNVGLNNCMELPEPYYSSIGSAGPDPGALCRLFDGSASGTNKCTGSGVAILQNPGNSALYTTSPTSPGYVAKYIQCVACSACT
ncbi:hypothetical protein V8F20_012008 [Naviculisporaceae sp. PSN 640]